MGPCCSGRIYIDSKPINIGLEIYVAINGGPHDPRTLSATAGAAVYGKHDTRPMERKYSACLSRFILFVLSFLHIALVVYSIRSVTVLCPLPVYKYKPNVLVNCC